MQVDGQHQNGRARFAARCGDECLVKMILDPIDALEQPKPLGDVTE
jgi:hypothetical protein